MYLSVCLSVCQVSLCLYVCLYICLSVCLSVCLSIYRCNIFLANNKLVCFLKTPCRRFPWCSRAMCWSSLRLLTICWALIQRRIELTLPTPSATDAIVLWLLLYVARWCAATLTVTHLLNHRSQRLATSSATSCNNALYPPPSLCLAHPPTPPPPFLHHTYISLTYLPVAWQAYP